MRGCGRALRRTGPQNSVSHSELVPSKPTKTNGWSWPPQAYQVVGWLVFSYQAVVGFGIYIPLLPPQWNHAAYALSAVAFIVHLVTHIAAVSIDPADVGVRTRGSYLKPKPDFDRKKQSHVIQDLHCYLCDITVGPKVKHCSVCNKCVGDFDHHCKWLNTCVGGRNYWCFFAALLSATLAMFLLLAILLYISIQHYLDPSSLRTDPHFEGLLANGTWLLFLPLAPIETSSTGLLAVAFVTLLISLICLLLLCHLLGFHFYLFYKGMSTYDYIRLLRDKEASKKRDEAGTHPAAHGNHVTTPGESVDCEPGVPQGSSSCQIDEVPLSSRMPESICSTMQILKEVENDYHYGTNSQIEFISDMAMSDHKGRKCDREEESPNPEWIKVKSVDRVPGVQNPLGSSIMAPDDTHQ